jgi:hypothetical protein
VTLKRERFGVDAARENEVAVQAADRRIVAVVVELGVLEALAGGREQLDERDVVTDLVGHGCAHATPSSRPVAGLPRRFDLAPITAVTGVVDDGERTDVTAVTPALPPYPELVPISNRHTPA